MSDIPELTESEISWIAYYETDTNINAEEMKDVSELESHTIYDNGIVLEYNINSVDRIATIRASDDGWITAHLDRTENYVPYDENNEQNMYENSFEDIDGIHDIIDWVKIDEISGNDWENVLSNSVNNELEKAIHTCLQNLDNYDSNISDEYEPENVGIYNYQYETNNISIFGQEHNSNDSSENNKVFDYNIVYTEETTIKKAILCSSGYSSSTNNSRNINLYFNDTHIFRGNNEFVHTAIDITDKISAGEEIKVGIGPGSGSWSNIKAYVIVLWE